MSSGNQRRAIAPALFTAVIAISFAAAFFKKAEPTHPVVMSGIRLTIAALLLSPFTIRGIITGRLRGAALQGGLLAGLFYGLHFGAWVTSLTLTSVAASVTLVTTTPLLLAIVGQLTGRDRPGRRVWLALALAVPGLLLIGGGDLSPEAMTGNGFALLGMAAIAAYFLLVRRLGADLDLLAFSGLACAVGATCLILAALALDIPLTPATADAWLWLALAALVPQLIGHNILTWALRHARPAQVAMAVVGEPVGATLIAWLWLNEAITLPTAIGCTITLAAVGLAVVASPSD